MLLIVSCLISLSCYWFTMAKRSSGNRNLAATIMSSQVSGRCLRTNLVRLRITNQTVLRCWSNSKCASALTLTRCSCFQLPQEFVEDVDRRLEFKEIPLLLAKLERNSSAQRFNATKCCRYVKVNFIFKFKLYIRLTLYTSSFARFIFDEFTTELNCNLLLGQITWLRCLFHHVSSI